MGGKAIERRKILQLVVESLVKKSRFGKIYVLSK